MDFNERQLAILLACLRFGQKQIESNTGKLQEFSDYFDECQPLTFEEINELWEQLSSQEDTYTYGLSWSTEDVKTAILFFEGNEEESSVLISDADALMVLQKVEQQTDANCGINWDFIAECASELKKQGTIQYQILKEEKHD